MTPLEAATPTHGYWIVSGGPLEPEAFEDGSAWEWYDNDGREAALRDLDLTILLANDQLVVVRKKRGM